MAGKKRMTPTVELLYLCNSEFRKEVDQIRETFQMKIFDEEKVNWQNACEFDSRLLNDTETSKAYIELVGEIARKYELEGSETDVEIFIESGVAPYTIDTVERGIHSGKFGAYKLSFSPTIKKDNEFAGHSLWLKLKIRKPVSITDFQEWLDTNAGEMVGQIHDCFKGALPAFSNADKPDRLVRIIELKKKRMTFKKIADKICEENPDDPDVIMGKVNEQSVKMLHNRHTKK